MIESSLEKHIAEGTLTHAYLISGSDEAGKTALTEEMAAAAVCSGTGKRPCRVCPDCRKAFSGAHPDIISLQLLKDKKDIVVDQIRDEIVSTAYVLPNDAAKKVYIIKDPMNIQAQNAFLKILEEPPKFVMMLIVTENAGSFLPTIRSRCTEVIMNNTHVAAQETEDVRILMDVIRKGTFTELAEVMFGLEKTERTAFKKFIAGAGSAAAERAAGAAEKGDDEGRRIYAKAAPVFAEAAKYYDFNVNVGHIAGFIMSELIELRLKK